jgi:hypothetical protein
MKMPLRKQIPSGLRAAHGQIGFGLQIHPTAIYVLFQLALLAQQTTPQIDIVRNPAHWLEGSRFGEIASRCKTLVSRSAN